MLLEALPQGALPHTKHCSGRCSFHPKQRRHGLLSGNFSPVLETGELPEIRSLSLSGFQTVGGVQKRRHGCYNTKPMESS